MRKGRLEFVEKNKSTKKTEVVELTEETEQELIKYTEIIEALISSDRIPLVLGKNSCKKCAYYEYCYI